MSDESPTLKPCPFCGGKPVLLTDGPWHSILCTNDECQAECPPGALSTLDGQVIAWNRRTPQ